MWTRRATPTQRWIARWSGARQLSTGGGGARRAAAGGDELLLGPCLERGRLARMRAGGPRFPVTRVARPATCRTPRAAHGRTAACRLHLASPCATLRLIVGPPAGGKRCWNHTRKPSAASRARERLKFAPPGSGRRRSAPQAACDPATVPPYARTCRTPVPVAHRDPSLVRDLALAAVYAVTPSDRSLRCVLGDPRGLPADGVRHVRETEIPARGGGGAALESTSGAPSGQPRTAGEQAAAEQQRGRRWQQCIVRRGAKRISPTPKKRHCGRSRTSRGTVRA